MPTSGSATSLLLCRAELAPLLCPLCRAGLAPLPCPGFVERGSPRCSCPYAVIPANAGTHLALALAPKPSSRRTPDCAGRMPERTSAADGPKGMPQERHVIQADVLGVTTRLAPWTKASGLRLGHFLCWPTARAGARANGEAGPEGVSARDGANQASNHCAAGAARTAKPARRAKGRRPGVKKGPEAQGGWLSYAGTRF